MKVVFETAGGQRLETELSGEEWEQFTRRLAGIFQRLRVSPPHSRNENNQAFIQDALKEYVLIAKEARD
jgi:hypothetical protein